MKYKTHNKECDQYRSFLLKRIIFLNFLPKKQVVFYIFLKVMASFFTLIIMGIIKREGGDFTSFNFKNL